MEANKKWKTECSAGDIDRFLEYFGIRREEVPPDSELISFSNCEFFNAASGVNQVIRYIENQPGNHVNLEGKIRITIDYDANFPVVVIRADER